VKKKQGLRCAICGNETSAGKTTFSTDMKFGVVVVRNVPNNECLHCGHSFFDSKIVSELEKIVADARANHRQVEVVAM
jgi:YgiT-type zinc finger domain-containing protein